MMFLSFICNISVLNFWSAYCIYILCNYLVHCVFSKAFVYFKLYSGLGAKNLEMYKENYSLVLFLWIGSQGSRAVPS